MPCPTRSSSCWSPSTASTAPTRATEPTTRRRSPRRLSTRSCGPTATRAAKDSSSARPPSGSPVSPTPESFGGPEVLEVRYVAEPHAGPGEVRVRVSAAGVNPVDWKLAGSAEAAGRFGVTLPAGFGNDLAGVVDEVGDGVTGFAAGDRVYGGVRGRAVADYAVARPGADLLLHTPDGVDDLTASTLMIAGRTADAVVSAIGVHAGDTVLIGGAAGGVGIFAVQLARRAGASEAAFGFLRGLGAAPVTYGDGLADRVRQLAPPTR